jgi:iron complex transport system ATP-binding protein
LTSEEIALSLDGVTVELGGKKILDNINAKVRVGEVFGIIGPNGSGKTTLLKCVSRTISPISGRISIRGKPIDAYSDRDFSIEVSAMLPHWPSGFSIDAYEIVLMGCRNRTKGIWGRAAKSYLSWTASSGS